MHNGDTRVFLLRTDTASAVRRCTREEALMSDLHDIDAATRAVLAAVHAATDQVQPPENARAMLLAIAATR